ncbi:TonB-dependent receptor [Membranihabitans marinus]
MRIKSSTSPLLLTFIGLFFMIGQAQAQSSFEVSGQLLDVEGNALIGATVLEKGSNNGTTSDFDGNFQLTVSSNQAVLEVSYIGYNTQEVEVNGNSVIEVVLIQSSELLDEVVVVGYGTQSREVMTSSVSKISSSALENTTAANPVQSLQGKAAGLSVNVTSGQPGDGAQVFIRGGTTPNSRDAANEPLYVIDGVFREDLVGINPNDIESIQVLKDAASTAIYGARAANGVILVTTKTGKGGLGSNIKVNYSYGIDQQNNLYPFTSAEDYIRVSREAAARGINLGNPGERLHDTKFGYSTQEISRVGEYGFERVSTVFLDDLLAVEGQTYVDRLINEQGYSTMMDPVTNKTILFKDNQYDEDHLFQMGTSHDVNLNASGGSENGYYNLSLGYLGMDGTVQGTASDRFTALANGVYNLRENLKIESGFNYQFDDIARPRSANNTINRSSRMPHTYRIWNDDGSPALGESNSSPRNIEHELRYQDDSYRNFRTSFRFGLDYEILQGLSIKANSSVYRKEYVLDQFERASTEITSRNMSRQMNTTNQFMGDLLLTYDRLLGKSHNINALLGSQYVNDKYEYFSGSGANAPTDLISTLNASETERERVSSSIDEGKLMSYFGRLNYDFQSKYLFGISARYDGSSRFATNNQWGFFPAVSLGWNIHQEDFWSFKNMSRFKIRASWGQAGNDNLSISDTRGLYSSTSYGLIGGAATSRLPNFNLKWETTTTTDIGLDFGFMNNRFNLLVDYYSKVTSDRLINQPLPAQTGFSSIRSNFGKLKNNGVEVELGGRILERGGFVWDMNFNVAFNNLAIIELPENENDKNRIGGGVIWDENGNEIQVGGLAEGERPYGLYAFEFLGVYSTDAEAESAPEDLLMSGGYRALYGGRKHGGDAIWNDINGDNIIDQRDVIFVGYRDPNKRGGWLNTFGYKNFSLRFNLDWAAGHMISNGWRARANANARNNVMTVTDVLSDEIWRNEGDIATIPRYDNASDFDNGPRNHIRILGGTSNSSIGLGTSNGADNTLYYEKGDWLAFREISLAYNLPQTWNDKVGLSFSRIALEFFNLGYLTSYSGLTPEHYDGVDDGIYPRPFQFRLRISTGL